MIFYSIYDKIEYSINIIEINRKNFSIFKKNTCFLYKISYKRINKKKISILYYNLLIFIFLIYFNFNIIY